MGGCIIIIFFLFLFQHPAKMKLPIAKRTSEAATNGDKLGLIT